MSDQPVDPIDTGVCDWIFDGTLRQKYPHLTDADLANFAQLLARPCPHCRAEPGQRCTTRQGRQIEDLDRQHVARHSYGRWGGEA